MTTGGATRSTRLGSRSAGGARRVSVVRDLGRPRSGQQLRERDLGARRSTGRVPPPPRRGLSGVLREHAAPPIVDAERAVAAALSRLFVRRAVVVLRARHAAVPKQSALWRRPQGAVPRGVRSERDAARTRAGTVAVRQPRSLAGAVARAAAAGDDGARRPDARARGVVFDGPVGRLRGGPHPRARLSRDAASVQSGGADRRHSQQLGERPQGRFPRPGGADRRAPSSSGRRSRQEATAPTRSRARPRSWTKTRS